MTTPARATVFLVDVDNTLLDNDRVAADLRHQLEVEVGPERRDRYWAIFEQLRVELGYADYLSALQRYRMEFPRDSHVLVISEYLVNYPFANRLYPGSLGAIAHLEQLGNVVLVTDGDVVFQPRKIHRSGLFDAVDGYVMIYIHKGQELEDVERCYPADHYVLIDDKLRILTAVLLRFSGEQYLAAADAYLRGLERRLGAGRSLTVASVASLFISRWDVAVAQRVPVEMHDVLGIAVAKQTYKAYRELIDSPRFGRLANSGARPQRLVWASTGTKDPAASDVLYLSVAGAVHHQHNARGDTARLCRSRRDRRSGARRRRRRRDSTRPLRARRRQRRFAGGPTPRQGANAFVRSWDALLDRIAATSHQLAAAG
jgi:hypothetical protein